MKSQLIITHPGGAHFDDMLGIGFFLASYSDREFKIQRRQPTPEELEDPDIWVLDIGGRYEPEKFNFDHHQDINLPATFVQVADFLGLLETMSIMPWWNFKDEVDRFGPTQASLKYDAGDSLVNRNPVEDWLTVRFVSNPQTALPMLKDMAEYFIESARLLKKQIDFWKSCRRLDIAGVPAMIGETRESAGLEEFRRLEENPPDIIISMDRRDDGWRLFRYDGTPVDFSLIADRPEISFAHNTGFLAKTKEKLDVDSLIKLLSRAIIRQ